MAGFQFGQEDAGQLAHAGGVAKVILHEMFHGAAALTITVSHAGRHLDLHVKGQLIHRAPRDVMQMAPNRPKKVFRPLENLKLFGGQQARPDKARGILHPVQVFADPVQGLQVTQAALALFHVGFQHIALAALAFVTFGAFGQLRLDKSRTGVFEQVGPQVIRQIAGQGRVADDKAVFQKRGADGDIFAAKGQAIAQGAGGMADLQFQIPQQIQQRFDQLFRLGRYFAGGQEQQVHIGMGGHFGAAIAADRQQRQGFGQGGGGVRLQMGQGDGPGGGDQQIGQVGLRMDQPLGLLRRGAESGCELGISGQFGRHQPRPGQTAQGLGIGAGKGLAAQIPQ